MSVLKKVTCEGTFTPTDKEIDDSGFYLPISRCRGTVPYAEQLYWHLNVWLAGKQDAESEGKVCVTFTTTKEVDAAVSLHLGSTGKTYQATLKNQHFHNFGPLQLYDDFLEAIDQSMRITVEFDVYVMGLNHNFYESCQHVEKDFTLIVENTDIPVHRNYLALISPVFNAMLSHRTKEAKSKQVEIVDFTMPTVHTVIRLCYGYFVTNIDVPLAIDMLRFVDKYDIKSARKQLEAYLDEKLTTENFTTIVKYAFDFSRESLMTICGSFYIKHQVDINKLREFVDLDPQIIASVLKAAWKTQNPEPAQVAAADVNADNNI